tara:strand:+ start:509 stop:799 length:291 start_codon:yes stop_codon:yes gene_type:complete
MSGEDIIKYEAYNILQIALKSEDDYEGHHAIIDRLNILINTLQLEDKLPSNILTTSEEEGDNDNNTSDDEEEDQRSSNDVEYIYKIIDDEVIVTAE